jgi:hypothetical protein
VVPCDVPSQFADTPGTIVSTSCSSLALVCSCGRPSVRLLHSRLRQLTAQLSTATSTITVFVVSGLVYLSPFRNRKPSKGAPLVPWSALFCWVAVSWRTFIVGSVIVVLYYLVVSVYSRLQQPPYVLTPRLLQVAPILISSPAAAVPRRCSRGYVRRAHKPAASAPRTAAGWKKSPPLLAWLKFLRLLKLLGVPPRTQHSAALLFGPRSTDRDSAARGRASLGHETVLHFPSDGDEALQVAKSTHAHGKKSGHAVT